MKKIYYFLLVFAVLSTQALSVSAAVQTATAVQEEEGDEYPIIVVGTGFTTDILEHAKGGETVTFTVTLYEGYQIKSVSAEWGGIYGGGNVSVTNKGGTTYQFTMPDEGELYIGINNEYDMDPDYVTVTIVTEQVSTALQVIIADSKISTSATSADAGTTVTLTIRPDENDRMTRLTVDGQNINFANITANLSETENDYEAYDWQYVYTYSFTMPQHNVSVSAAFETTFGIVVEYATNCVVEVPHRAAAGEQVAVNIIPEAGYLWTGEITIHDSNYSLYVEDEDAIDENGLFTMPDDLYSPEFDIIYIGASCTAQDTPNALDAVSVEPAAVKLIENGNLIIRRGGNRYTLAGEAL